MMSREKNQEKKIAVLFVCLGNICRSPMAEAIFQHYVREKGLENIFQIESAGTSDYHQGEDYHSETIAVVRKNNIEIHGKSRPVQLVDFQKFDYIIAMDESNLIDLKKMNNDSSSNQKISLILEYLELLYEPGLDVPDPYYGGRDGFEHVFELLSDACRGLLNKITHQQGIA